ncbi:hydrolase [Fusibacter ferrireducens]|uniref:Uncharacterized protein n=1 Tax=Fusibacter ferrireducens TaxID=2785058 RepID=A0ABR9ZPU6_9FIRM|nr:hydrolase [Fusibacter ferrireducens]MBF4692439.1 hypothetical protein [Fusibacter ferrireducens]
MEVLKKLPEMDLTDNETGCCPRFHPEKWHDQIMNLENYQFVKVFTKSMLHMPLNMGKVFSKTMNEITAAGADVKDKYLILSRDLSAWKAEHYFLVEKEVQGLENTKLSGDFFTSVYEGEFKEMPTWMKDLKEKTNGKGLETDDFMAFYTTCPKCAKHYGKNYVVLFTKIKKDKN